MSSGLIFLICFLAIAIGWFLGKFPLRQYWQRWRNRGWHQSYLQVMRILLNEQSDQAIESFVRHWPVTPENMELHNALANMLRKKGEVDRAIRIHISLVECNRLSQPQIRQATIELARDYMAAGLLDHAERLLINVVNNASTYDERALELLQRIYQMEKEWDKAIAVAEQLLPKNSMRLTSGKVIAGQQTTDIAHYYCEIAAIALKDDRFSDVEKALNQALRFDANCARASMMQAEMAIERGRTEQALQALENVQQQDCRLLPECLPLINACFTGDEAGLSAYLMRLQQSYPSSAIEQAVFNSLQKQQNAEAEPILQAYVARRPTLEGIRNLARHQLDTGSDNTASGQAALLYQLVGDVLKSKHTYQCRECGFSGMQLHWLCPQCQHWDTIRRRRGSEGD